jgi:hypothetical protein
LGCNLACIVEFICSLSAGFALISITQLALVSAIALPTSASTPTSTSAITPSSTSFIVWELFHPIHGILDGGDVYPDMKLPVCRILTGERRENVRNVKRLSAPLANTNDFVIP